jgi:hypothetical protein
MDAHQLAELDDQQYEQLIVSNAHPPARDPEVWAALTDPSNLERTREIIVNVHQRTGNTLRTRKSKRDEFQQECFTRGEAGKRDWYESRAEYENWRRRAANFHQCMQRAISELSKLQRKVNRDSNMNLAQENRETLRKLSIAVQRHQAMRAKTGQIAAQEDYELWQLLDTLTVPCGPNQEPTALRTMLDFYWTDVTPVDDGQEQRALAERTMRSAPGGRSSQYEGVPKARHVGSRKNLAS